MAGGVRQHFAVAVAVGVTDDRLPPEFPDLAAAANLLHTDRIDLTKIKSSIVLSVGDLSNLSRQAAFGNVIRVPPCNHFIFLIKC